MPSNIPETDKERVVIAGAGFAGLRLARKLKRSGYQVVLLDKNNYHQFQPLLYQVATAGLEPSAISFPLRKVFHDYDYYHVRLATLLSVEPEKNRVQTSLGILNYDHLVLALGGVSNFYGNRDIEEKSFPMKSISDALALRNLILEQYEKAVSVRDPEEREALMNILIAGGGPTGVELAGALAEMKKYVLPKDYPDLDFSEMTVMLVEGLDRLLPGFTPKASGKARRYLEKIGVEVSTETLVTAYDGKLASTNQEMQINTRCLIWTAGIKSEAIQGIPDEAVLKGGRIKVNEFNRVQGFENIYAIGDLAAMIREDYPAGHPQLAPVAIQMAENLARNLKNNLKNKSWKAFRYQDQGIMATVGRNKAVVDLKRFKLFGFLAWIIWMAVHLMSIVGVKNRILIFINWFWAYVSYDQSLRIIIKPKHK